MKKKTIEVPDGIKYLSEWKELQDLLPKNEHYILNKKVCGCGATEAFLNLDKKVILTSPRKHLLYNKYSQHLSDNFHLFRYLGNREQYFESKSYTEHDILVFNDNLKNYLLRANGTKILTTYDSLRKIKDVLEATGENLDEWIVVVDEMQVIFYDCQFKPTTEYEFGMILEAFKNVVYLSATPFLESYLGMTKQFKNLTIYELAWPSSMVQLPNVEVVKSRKSVSKLCSELISLYKEGKGKATMVDGKEFRAKEAVFYINDVSIIKSVIKKNNLKADEVNIICSAKSENIKKLKELSKDTGDNFKIGEIPGKGEPHKMFTFCTSTVYVGADFYSTNAYSYIFANPLIKSMTVDVSVDLQQIIGRQRLDENPFRNSATLYFNTRKQKVTKEELEETIKEKKESTQKQIDNFNAVPNKAEQLRMMESNIKQQGHQEHYCCILKDANDDMMIVENELIEISERRAWEVTNKIYNQDWSMYAALKAGATVTKSSDSNDPEIQKIFKEWEFDNKFQRKAKLFCDLYDKSPTLLDGCTFIEKKFRKYYEALGRDGFEALHWREDNIKKALEPTPFDKLPKDKIAAELIKSLRLGEKYTKSDIKDMLASIYKQLGIAGTPSASDVSEYLTCSDKTIRIKGKPTAYFTIKSHYRTTLSLFSKITDINHPNEYDIDKVLDIIKTDSYYNVAEKVDAVRKAKNDESKDKAKMKLPAVTWNGTFKSKNRKDLIHYSSFTALDFDHIQPENMDGFGKWLQGFSCVYACFVTPSGEGYKAIILHDNYEPLYHYDLYNQLLNLFDCPEIDKSTTDLARGNFLSYDPNLWKNPEPKPYHFTPTTTEPLIPDFETETIIRDSAGNEIVMKDDSKVSQFLNQLYRQVISDESIIRILRSIWNGKSLANGRNNTAMSYAGVLCKAGVMKDKAKAFIEELIPDYDITEIVDYAYSHNTFGCERRRYKSRQK